MSDDPQLAAACIEFAHLLRPAAGGTVKQEALRLTTSLESTITRLDEFSAFLEEIHSGHTAAEPLLVELTAQCRIVEQSFARIDRVQEYMDALERAVRDCEDRLTTADAQLANEREEREERLAQERSTSSIFASLSSAFSSLKKLTRSSEPTQWAPVHVPDFDRSMAASSSVDVPPPPS